MKQFKKKEFAIIPTKVKMATKVNKPFINAISMNEPMKVVMDFGRNKTEYDELPSGRKYLTPSEIVAIQELNLDEKSPLGTVRDAFTLQCIFGGSIAANVGNKKDIDAYCHCVGVLLVLAGIVQPVQSINVAGSDKNVSFYHTFYANPKLASRSYPIDHLVMLAELDDKEAGQMAKAIAQYANKGIAPSFSNSALKAIFTLFRSNIEAQRESSAKRSEINTTNAMGKKSAAKKKVVKRVTSTDSESQQIADDVTETSDVVEESLPLDAIEAVYPKLGTYRNESLSIWESFNEEKKRKAIGFVQTYISQTPNAIDQMYLNRYLGAEPWEK